MTRGFPFILDSSCRSLPPSWPVRAASLKRKSAVADEYQHTDSASRLLGPAAMRHGGGGARALLVIGDHELGDKGQAIAARRALAEMAIDEAGREHDEGLRGAD